MIYRIIYGIAVIWVVVIGIVLAVAGWVLYGHLWYRLVDWLERATGRVVIWVLDRTLGNHETINGDEDDESYRTELMVADKLMGEHETTNKEEVS